MGALLVMAHVEADSFAEDIVVKPLGDGNVYVHVQVAQSGDIMNDFMRAHTHTVYKCLARQRNVA